MKFPIDYPELRLVEQQTKLKYAIAEDKELKFLIKALEENLPIKKTYYDADVIKLNTLKEILNARTAKD